MANLKLSPHSLTDWPTGSTNYKEMLSHLKIGSRGVWQNTTLFTAFFLHTSLIFNEHNAIFRNECKKGKKHLQYDPCLKATVPALSETATL